MSVLRIKYLTDVRELRLLACLFEKFSKNALDCLHKAVLSPVSISVVTFQITMSFLEDLLEWFFSAGNEWF